MVNSIKNNTIKEKIIAKNKYILNRIRMIKRWDMKQKNFLLGVFIGPTLYVN